MAIAAWNAAPVIEPDAGAAVGGLETFAWLLARALIRQEQRQVTLVVRHTRRFRRQVYEGVSIAPLIEPLRPVRMALSRSVDVQDAFPWLRVRQWRFALLWQLPLLASARLLLGREPPDAQLLNHLRQIRPDVWVALGCSAESAAVMQVAAEMHRSSILWIRSNADLDPRLFREAEFVNPYGVRAKEAQACIEAATEIVCQTEWQQQQLQELTARRGRLIRNPIEIELWNRGTSEPNQLKYVLWIGRYDRFHKRPHLCLEAARQLPDIPFVMVVNRHDEQVEREISAAAPANVRLIDYVPRHEMPAMFAQARLFLSTGSGEHEGFPNVLLEAAASGVPIVSYEDFDDFLRRSGAGRCAEQDLNRLVEDLRALWTDEPAWRSCSAAAQAFIRKEHGLSELVAQFDKLLVRLSEE